MFYVIIGIGFIMLFAFLSKKNRKNFNDENNKKIYIEPVETKSDEELIETENTEKFPYILTNCVFSNKESKFYNSLKRITDKHNLVVFTKMRIADIVYLPRNHPEFIRWFNYIKAKHIDFIVCNSVLKPVLLIEVDDSTHDRENRIKRDEFVDKIFNQLNLPIFHIRLWEDEALEKQIIDLILNKKSNI